MPPYWKTVKNSLHDFHNPNLAELPNLFMFGLRCSWQAEMQATDALMEQQAHATGPITSWMTSFAAWAENSTNYRCGARFVNASRFPVRLNMAHI